MIANESDDDDNFLNDLLELDNTNESDDNNNFPNTRLVLDDNNESDDNDNFPNDLLVLDDTSSASSSHAHTSPTQPNKSGGSSPTKQVTKPRIDATMQYRMIDDGSDDFPESLGKLLGPIRRATTHCRNLFFGSQRQEIRDYVQADPTRRRSFEECYNSNMLLSNSFVDLFDPVCLREYKQRLSPEFVHFIFSEARECDESLHPDASWNMLVRYPLMHRAIVGAPRWCDVHEDKDKDDRNRLGDQGSGSAKPLVTLVPCTTATLIDDFKTHDSPAHGVDFVIALEPDWAVADRIDTRRRSMPGLSVNHTDYTPLVRRPIAISVKTDDDFGTARAQLMGWLAAQWEKLESMTDRPTDILPAIIIQRHEWYLIASTWAADGKKVGWPPLHHNLCTGFICIF